MSERSENLGCTLERLQEYVNELEAENGTLHVKMLELGQQNAELKAELEKATELNDITDGRICEVEEKWAEYKADSKRLDKLDAMQPVTLGEVLCRLAKPSAKVRDVIDKLEEPHE